MSTGFLYLLLKCDSIIGMMRSVAFFPAVILFVGILLFVTAGIIQFSIWCNDSIPPITKGEIADRDNVARAFRKVAWTTIAISLPVFLVVQLIIGLLPTTREMAIIYVVPKVLENPAVCGIPNKLLTLSNEWLEELRPGKVKKAVAEAVEEKKG
jgi:hypothetical protein